MAFNHQTPPQVWLTSIVATLTIHAGGLWWLVSAWQNSGSNRQPAPIRVIAVSTANAAPAPQSLPRDLPPLPAPLSDPPDASSAASQSSSPTVTAAPSAASQPTVLPPSGPTSQPELRSARPASTPTAPRLPESTTSPVSEVSPSVSASPAPSSTHSRVAIPATWGLRPVPEGADIPDVLPALPPTWQQSVNLALASTQCWSDSAVLTVELRLTVEADGRISESRPWGQAAARVDAELLRCLDRIITSDQVPPLMPAQMGGYSVPTDMVVLTVERSTPE